MSTTSLDRLELGANRTRRTAPLKFAPAVVLATLCLCGCPKREWHYAPPPPPAASSKDFDAQWDGHKLDPNGAATNVDWTPQLQGRIPNPDSCNGGQPYTPACTQNLPFQDQPDGLHEAFCFIGKAATGNLKPFFGHADWMVAQYDGSIGWFNFGDDWDYDLLLVPGALPQGAGNEHGITTNNNHVAGISSKPQYIEMEFDSSETDSVFDQGWWKQFQTSGHANDVPAIADLLHPGKKTLACGSALGVFGLDCDHGCRSEIHPIYALAIQRTEDPGDNQWSVLVRNWGTGGYCSQYNDELAETSVSLVLPYNSSQPPSAVTIQDFMTGAQTGSGAQCPKVYFQNGRAILNLTLPPPENKAVAAFSVKIQWPAGAQSVACTEVSAKEAAFALAHAEAPNPSPSPNGEEYMGALLRGASQTVHPDLMKDILPTVPKQMARMQALPRMALSPQAPNCNGPVSITPGPPPPSTPVPARKLQKDPGKRIRDDAVRSYICRKYQDQHIAPPVGTAQDLEAACKGVK